MSQKTWGGRFSGTTDERVEAFTESITLDRRLFRHDIAASQAHARMLAHVGLLTAGESEQIVHALDAIGDTIERGEMQYSTSLEDIHTHIERALIERLGDVGRKLHTGRSRNDQVATDTKLWTREAIDLLDSQLLAVQRALLTAARAHEGVVIPGYTHLQRAQPVLAAHYYCAYIEKFQRDRERLADCRKRVNILPLGCAALAGTTLPIDREHVQQSLEFAAITRNSLDTSSDRDFALEFLFGLSLIATHLSGWAEEWIIWATTEFNFIELPDAFCTGSSIMPHKKNPDVLELIRGKTGRVIGDLQQMFFIVKGLPLAYNRDLQEDKSALFDAFDTVSAMLALAAPLIESSRLRQEAIASRLEDGFLDATTLMEKLIAVGVPMRSAHEAVGRLVRQCEQASCRLVDLPDSAYNDIQPDLANTVRRSLGVPAAIAAFASAGSTSPTEVEKQLAFWSERLTI